MYFKNYVYNYIFYGTVTLKKRRRRIGKQVYQYGAIAKLFLSKHFAGCVILHHEVRVKIIVLSDVLLWIY